MAGIYQLTFWHDALQTLGRQNQSTLLPRQPVIGALKEYTQPSDFSLLLNLVAARQETLGDRPFSNVTKLEENSKLLYGSLILLQMRALHVSAKENEIISNEVDDFLTEKEQYVVNSMASAIGILTLLRATTLLLRDGIVLLPNDLTTLHGIDSNATYRGAQGLKAVAKDLCEIGTAHLMASRSLTQSVPTALRPALLSAGLRCDHLLSILHRNNFNLLDVRLHQSHPLAGWKLWWRNRKKIF